MTLTELEATPPAPSVPPRSPLVIPLAGAVAVMLSASVITAAVGVGSTTTSAGHAVSASRLSELRGVAQQLNHLTSYRSTVIEDISGAGITGQVSIAQLIDAAHHESSATEQTSLAGEDSTSELITTATHLYQRKVTASGPGPWSGAPVPAGLQALGKDSSLGVLEAFDHVSDLGSQSIDGVRTEHYRGTLSTSLLAKVKTALQSIVPDTTSANAEQAYALAVKAFAHTPFDVYVDDQGLPREMTYVAKISAQGHSVTIRATARFTDFNKAVQITVPAPSAVTELSSAQELLTANLP